MVWIPAQLRALTGGRATVDVPGQTVRQVIESLERLHPGIKDRLCEGETLRSGLAVAVGSRIATRGLAEAVEADSEVHFLPAIAGG